MIKPNKANQPSGSLRQLNSLNIGQKREPKCGCIIWMEYVVQMLKFLARSLNIKIKQKKADNN